MRDQAALVRVGVGEHEALADAEPEHGVAGELEALVRRRRRPRSTKLRWVRAWSRRGHVVVAPDEGHELRAEGSAPRGDPPSCLSFSSLIRP